MAAKQDDTPDKKAKPAEQAKSASERPTSEKQKLDPLVLQKVIVDPLAVLNYQPPPFSQLSKDCLFFLDTNALLEPLKIANKVIADIAKVYETLWRAKRLFFPAHAVREYGKNREGYIRQLHENVNHAINKLHDATPPGCNMLEAFEQYSDVVQYSTEVTKVVREYRKKLLGLRELLEDFTWTDPVSVLYRKVITAETLFDANKTDEELEADLKWRVLHKLPPGYKDSAKDDGGIGDLVIWHSLIHLAKRLGRNVLFVSNDTKADWTLTSNKQVVSLRPELTLEFFQATGHYVGAVTYSRFLEIAGAAEATMEAHRRSIAALRQRWCNYVIHVMARQRNALRMQCVAWTEIVDEHREATPQDVVDLHGVIAECMDVLNEADEAGLLPVDENDYFGTSMAICHQLDEFLAVPDEMLLEIQRLLRTLSGMFDMFVDEAEGYI